MNFKRIFLRNKNNKIYYYIKAILRELVPGSLSQAQLKKHLNSAYYRKNATYIDDRVNYYNKLERLEPLDQDAIEIGS